MLSDISVCDTHTHTHTQVTFHGIQLYIIYYITNITLSSPMHLLLHIHLEEDIRVHTPGHAPMTVSTVAVPSMPKSPPAAGTIQVLIRVCVGIV